MYKVHMSTNIVVIIFNGEGDQIGTETTPTPREEGRLQHLLPPQDCFHHISL